MVLVTQGLLANSHIQFFYKIKCILLWYKREAWLWIIILTYLSWYIFNQDHASFLRVITFMSCFTCTILVAHIEISSQYNALCQLDVINHSYESFDISCHLVVLGYASFFLQFLRLRSLAWLPYSMDQILSGRGLTPFPNFWLCERSQVPFQLSYFWSL